MVSRRRLRAVGVALLLAAGAAHAQAWRIDAGTGTPPLDADAQAASARLIDTVLARLPPAWRAAEGLDVQLSWRDDLPPQVHGRAIGDRIVLRRALLDAVAADGLDAQAMQAASAALVHELAHRYDRSRYGGLSRDPRLRDLAGWPRAPLRLGLRARHNAMTDRRPDAYETASAAEFVAVNLEHFLLDPEYACRRPALHAYFTAHFAWAPPAADCAGGLPFIEAEPQAQEDGHLLLELDPARVWSVEYLFAEGNAQPMSRWGHSMLRLVICAPGRTPGPECRYDLAHHRVLSFRAFVDDVQISSLRGLTGRYPARLFVLPLDQVIDEYTRIELRGLQSIPLHLSPGEIATLLERAASVHWSYDGRYRFVGNNCAVETWKLLDAGVPRLDGPRLRSITPNGLLRRLVRDGIADVAVLDAPDRAMREGYYFPAADREYAALLAVAQAAQPLPTGDVATWLDLDPDLRAPWLATAGQRDGAALLVLEHAAQRRLELRLRNMLKRRWHLAAADQGAAADTLQALLAAGDGLSRPAQLLDRGYGLPQQTERAALRVQADALGHRLRALRDALDTQGRAALPPDAQRRLATTERNVAMLGAHLRELHREAGGLQLD
ncbi:DUF4105 domain-containing protein [Luteimonas sp. TWI662]|uniref:DUF7844 domain-containing protein n=1 Tax=Luteimonas sp. TWI662 TaxID=3136789 RepID=UPI0032079BAC